MPVGHNELKREMEPDHEKKTSVKLPSLTLSFSPTTFFVGDHYLVPVPCHSLNEMKDVELCHTHAPGYRYMIGATLTHAPVKEYRIEIPTTCSSDMVLPCERGINDFAFVHLRLYLNVGSGDVFVEYGSCVMSDSLLADGVHNGVRTLTFINDVVEVVAVVLMRYTITKLYIVSYYVIHSCIVHTSKW